MSIIIRDESTAATLAAATGTPDCIAAAIEALNTRLQSHPQDVGESRSGRQRITFVPPFAIGFQVSETERIVRVFDVKRYGIGVTQLLAMGGNPSPGRLAPLVVPLSRKGAL